MRRASVWVAVIAAAALLWWGLVAVANHWLLPALDCVANGGESCSSSALVGVVAVAALAMLYGGWRLLKRLTGPRQ